MSKTGWLKGFAKVGLAVGGAIVPEIAAAQAAFDAIGHGQTKKEKVMAGVLGAPDIINLLESGQVINRALFLEGVDEIREGYVKVMQACKPGDGPDL